MTRRKKAFGCLSVALAFEYALRGLEGVGEGGARGLQVVLAGNGGGEQLAGKRYATKTAPHGYHATRVHVASDLLYSEEYSAV